LDPKKLEELAKQEVDEVKIERFSPTGELNAVPALSIQFNQPMIALSSVSDIELMDVPATLEPQVPGKWVWKGTQNLQVMRKKKKNHQN
jgi:alpha-2-macroglobulin